MPHVLSQSTSCDYSVKPAKIVGVIYNPRVPMAVSMGREIFEALSPLRQCWIESAVSEEIAHPLVEETDLIITVGGDGTILRAVRVAVHYNIPILGVNLGRLGFMTELRADEALPKISHYLEGAGWLEERSMLQVQVVSGDGMSEGDRGLSYDALNDAVLVRGAVARLVRVRACVDGVHFTSYRADAVIICTATGSTGYNLSAGGPILHPQAPEMVLKPVAPHIGLATAVVLPKSSIVKLTVESTDPAILSVDGYQDLTLKHGDGVRIQSSPRKAQFLREGSPERFYATLTRRLGFDESQAVFY